MQKALNLDGDSVHVKYLDVSLIVLIFPFRSTPITHSGYCERIVVYEKM